MHELASGKLSKLVAGESLDPIQYYIQLSDSQIKLNDFLGKMIRLEYLNEILCIQCHRKTKRSFHQGYCYPCMKRLAECDFCIIHPDRCHSKHTVCAADDWAHAHCNQSHIVYLANSSGLKVGITRERRKENRWIDQGASQGIALFEVGNRYQSGVIETCLKQFVNDRTDWRKLLRSPAEPLNLAEAAQQLLTKAETALAAVMATLNCGSIHLIDNPQMVTLSYPILCYPKTLTTLSFDKSPVITGVLQGIKGQYLILDTGVINIRKFSGYLVRLLAM